VSDQSFARKATAALLKLAKTTSDPRLAAGLVERAADLKDRLDELPPPVPEAKGAAGAQQEETRGRPLLCRAFPTGIPRSRLASPPN
jgi:hypothetical protein